MDELKNMAPKLSGIKKDGMFSVPDDYFESFRDKLEEKLHAQKVENEQEPKNKKSLLKTLKPYLAIAATLTGIMLAWHILFQKLDIYTTENIAYVDKTELVEINEVEIALNEIEEDVIIDFVCDEQLPDQYNIETNDIIAYLSEEDITLEDISMDDIIE